MRDETLLDIIDLCRKMIKNCEALRATAGTTHDGVETGTKLSAQVRRLSLDLTRRLADLRAWR